MPRRQKGRQGEYQVHPSIHHAQAMVANLPVKTGRDIGEWLSLLDSAGVEDQREAVAWLQREHDLGRGTAVLIAEVSQPDGAVRVDEAAYLAAAQDYVAAQYEGPRSHLRPILDALLEMARSLGGDIRICPGKTMVPIYRVHVIANVRATTRKRVDLGLALRGSFERKPSRLIETGGLEKGDRITHRVPLSSLDEVDNEVGRWLQVAYTLDS